MMKISNKLHLKFNFSPYIIAKVKNIPNFEIKNKLQAVAIIAKLELNRHVLSFKNDISIMHDTYVFYNIDYFDI